jgi:hypothetical protein
VDGGVTPGITLKRFLKSLPVLSNSLLQKMFHVHLQREASQPQGSAKRIILLTVYCTGIQQELTSRAVSFVWLL